jgi:polysaccharide biosynthesis protein PslH
MAQVLTVIPYNKLFPPQNGGQLRCFHMLQELAREHQVHAIILQPERELRHPNFGYRFPASVKVYGPAQTPPPPTLFDHLPGRLGPALHYRWLLRSWQGPASSVLLETHHLFRQILTGYKIDAVILTTLSSICVAPLVRRLRPRAIRILNTENVEHHLLAQAIQRGNGDKRQQKARQKNYTRARWYEAHLARFVHTFWACSDDDREILEALNQEIKGFTLANGVDTSRNPFDGRRDKGECGEILFCGSLDYEPNRDGILWFHREIWPLIIDRRPDLRLVVVGRGAAPEDYGPLRADPTVDFVGDPEDMGLELPEVVPYYHRTGILVVPLRMGSGTRFKILESMSLGSPVISTRLGAQGIDAVDGEHLVLADEPAQFAAAVERLLSNAERFEQVRRSARSLVEQRYDWRVIGQTMNRIIDTLTASERTL